MITVPVLPAGGVTQPPAVTTNETDFAFHYTIMEASMNKRFPEFLSLIRSGLISRVELVACGGARRA